MSNPDPTTGFPPPLSEHLCLWIYGTNLEIQRIHKVVLDGLGITYPQYLVLNLLWERDHQPVGELATQLRLEASTVTPLLKRLEAGGYLNRVRNPADERQVLIGLTDKGRELRHRAGCVSTNLAERAGMSADELQELNARIRDLHDRLVATAQAGEG
ncbi:MAG: MarR family transcriptional regulator [Alphaproteobacteria bacterium HGW-Alphaproteobacteria-18]|nr:MAG: MarR family transcriptional regulator [Alphaproteobacteria bacterium HGW-Alphaproteobacteria-18]